jgi:ABC-2 type transport system ATP-binding protein
MRSSLLVGDRVHLFVDEAARRLPDLLARLESAGVAYDSIKTVAPTIEDLFVMAVDWKHGVSGEMSPS